MATIDRRKKSDGTLTYRVQIRKRGFKTVSKTFLSLQSAKKWAREIQTKQDQGFDIDIQEAQTITFAEIIERYKREIIPQLVSQAEELSKCNVMVKAIGDLSLMAITPSILASHRDKRLQQGLSPTTVNYDLSFVSRVFTACIKDFSINLPNGNPVKKVRKPSLPRGRERRPTKSELNILSGYPFIMFAIETAMRRGEIARMDWKDVNWTKQTLHIPVTKNSIPRTIPLSSTAISILKALPCRSITGNVWQLKPDSITDKFRRLCKRHNISDLRFHDLRHEATSRLFEKGLHPVEVATITGHTDTKMLLRYTHIKPESLIDKLG